MEYQIKITMLTSNNGYRWMQEITSAFYRSNVYSVVSGKRPKPTDVLELENWTRSDNLANAIIHDSLSPDLRSFFNWELSSYTNLENFKKLSSDKSTSAIREIKREIESLDQGSTEGIMDYYNRWTTQILKLKDAGGMMEEKDEIELFLRSLDAKYNPVKGSIDLTATGLKMEKLVERLKNFEYISKQKFGIMHNDEVNHLDQKSDVFNLNIVCFNCGGYAHRPSNCPSPTRGRDVKIPHLGPIIKERTAAKKKKKSKVDYSKIEEDPDSSEDQGSR